MRPSLLINALAWTVTLGVKGRQLSAGECLPSGDERAINDALAEGGHGASVILCPGSVHRLHDSIEFTAPGQFLGTEGDPIGHDRALLIVEGLNQSVAIKGDCKHCERVTVRSLIVNGNRPRMLRVKDGDALLSMGNADYQRVQHCKLFEPRGWSALHFREGDDRSCRKAYAGYNEIGPCGEEWDDDYDGVNHGVDDNNWGLPSADGISLACKESLIEHNTITDTTDGGIVIFGSAGSEIRENRIVTQGVGGLGGINLVDIKPWGGEYTEVHVHHNSIHALGSMLAIGIAIGHSTWKDDTEWTISGGTVNDNRLYGEHFAYGIVVSSVSDFTVLGNTIDPGAKFNGILGSKCPKAPENAGPTALLYNRGSSKGVFQSDFINGNVQHMICVMPPPIAQDRLWKPIRYMDSPELLASKLVSKSDLIEEQLTEALVQYQVNVVTAINGIEARIADVGEHGKSASPAAVGSQHPKASSPYSALLESLEQKVSSFEAKESQLESNLRLLERQMKGKRKSLKEDHSRSKQLVAAIDQLISDISLRGPDDGREQSRRSQGSGGLSSQEIEHASVGRNRLAYGVMLGFSVFGAAALARQRLHVSRRAKQRI